MSSRKLLGALLLVPSIAASACTPAPRAEDAAPADRSVAIRERKADHYHRDTLEVARWLENVAVESDHGLKWPRVPAAETPEFETSLYSGSCGPVLFFLALAQSETGETKEHWMELARDGAEELVATLPDQCEGEGCGLYTGIAGVGFTLEQAWLASGSQRFRDGARRCVDLLQKSARLAGSGLEWSDTTDVIAGGAGIGAFLLAMNEDEHDELALDLATRAGRRLLDRSQREAVGRSWRMDSKFPRVMPNFSHGTAGIAWFLARLHEVTGKQEFLDAARDGADHLLSIADRRDDGCRIHHDTPDNPDLYYLGWCHGPCGTTQLFAKLAAITGEEAYADAVRGGARSVMTSGLPQPLPGFWNNVSRCCGSAGVIEFMLERTRATDDRSFQRFAETVADDLLARGTRDDDGLSFVQAEHRVKPELLEAQTGLMQGAAGIGLALLDLEECERGESSRLLFPDER